MLAFLPWGECCNQPGRLHTSIITHEKLTFLIVQDWKEDVFILYVHTADCAVCVLITFIGVLYFTFICVHINNVLTVYIYDMMKLLESEK